MAHPSSRRTAWVLASLALLGCRKGSDTQNTSFLPVVPSPFGTQACWPLAAVPSAADAFPLAVIGPMSQIAAAAGSETLFLTGNDGSIHRLDFAGGGAPPVDTVLVASGVIEASFLVPAGIGLPAELSGIAVLDNQFLVVAEHTSNTLLAVRRDLVDTVVALAGLPLGAGGFSDGVGGAIRFHFTQPVSLLAEAGGSVFVGDSENHALRSVQLVGLPSAATVAGTGAPGTSFGALPSTQLDTPSGLAGTCAGELLVLESGRAGFGGNRLLSLAIGSPSFFGGFEGSSIVLAGNGLAATVEGVGTQASLGTPEGLVTSDDGRAYWVDSNEGILRRFDLATGLCDCPQFASCAAAVTAGGTYDGAHFSLALGDSGSLYLLEADAGVLHRIDP